MDLVYQSITVKAKASEPISAVLYKQGVDSWI
jgi:hypothetical protein